MTSKSQKDQEERRRKTFLQFASTSTNHAQAEFGTLQPGRPCFNKHLSPRIANSELNSRFASKGSSFGKSYELSTNMFSRNL